MGRGQKAGSISKKALLQMKKSKDTQRKIDNIAEQNKLHDRQQLDNHLTPNSDIALAKNREMRRGSNATLHNVDNSSEELKL